MNNMDNTQESEVKNDLQIIEEKLNTVTHGIGTGMSVFGLIVLMAKAAGNHPSRYYISFALYGSFQILLYLASTLTHAFHDMPRTRYFMRILDQVSVYLLIAGTYTPVALMVLQVEGDEFFLLDDAVAFDHGTTVAAL